MDRRPRFELAPQPAFENAGQSLAEHPAVRAARSAVAERARIIRRQGPRFDGASKRSCESRGSVAGAERNDSCNAWRMISGPD